MFVFASLLSKILAIIFFFMVSSTQQRPCAVPVGAAFSLGNIHTITWSTTIPGQATAAAKPGKLVPRCKPFLSTSPRSIIRPFMEGNTLIRSVFLFNFWGNLFVVCLFVFVSICDYNKCILLCWFFSMGWMRQEVWVMFLLDGTSGMYWWVFCFIMSLSHFFLSAAKIFIQWHEWPTSSLIQAGL